MIPGRNFFVCSLNGSTCNSGTIVYVRRSYASEITKPKPGLRFVPVMITRLVLSLKKAATSREDGWSLGEPTITHNTMRFAECRGGVATRDEIPLDTFASTHEGTQSRA